MSAFGATDGSVGLQLYDLSCAPSVAAAKFAFLRPDQSTVSVPRVYFVALCCGVNVPGADATDERQFSPGAATATTAALSVVAVTYNLLIVGDLESGKLTHKFRHGRDIMGLLRASKTNWIGVLTSGTAAGGDLCVQLPVAKDAQRFLETLKTLHAHHTGGTIGVEKLSNTDELRSRVYLQPTSEESSHALSEPVVLSRQMYSVINAAQPLVTDRLGGVRSQFKELEAETKEAAVDLHKNLDSVSRKASDEEDEANTRILQLQEGLEFASVRASELDRLEKRIAATKQETEVAEEQLKMLSIELSLKEQHWQGIIQGRQSEELKQKRALVERERSYLSSVEDIRSQIGDVDEEIASVRAQLAVYESEEYAQAEEERNEAVMELEYANMDLDEFQSPEVLRKKAKTLSATQELLKVNAALRRVALETSAELDKEKQVHIDLANDVKQFEEELVVFSDADLLLVARANNARDALETAKAQIQTVADRIQFLESSLETGPPRPLYTFAQAKLQNAATRRRKMESTLLQQEKERTERRTDLQQQLFDVKLRVSSLKRYL